MRALMFPGQLVLLLVILYAAEFFQTDAFSSCGACLVPEFSIGFGQFVGAIFSGAWGDVTYGRLLAPAS